MLSPVPSRRCLFLIAIFTLLLVLVTFIGVQYQAETLVLSSPSEAYLREEQPKRQAHQSAELLSSYTQDRGLQQRQQAPFFYVYDDPAIRMTQLESCAFWNTADFRAEYGDRVFLGKLENHPARVRNPADAEVFVIPIPLESSYRADKLEQCPGHLQRLNEAWQALKATPTFRRHGGRRHFWWCDEWWCLTQWADMPGLFPEALLPDLRNITIAKYIDFRTSDRECERWGKDFEFCDAKEVYRQRWEVADYTVVVPFLTDPHIVYDSALTYRDWALRPSTLFYRTADRASAHKSTEGRRTAVALGSELPDADLKYHTSPEEFARDISQAKFCLVIRGDDPGSHNLLNALRAGCIPVIISSGNLMFVRPFVRVVPWSLFTIEIPENWYLEHPKAMLRYVYELREEERRRLFEAMMTYRRDVLLRAEDSRAPDLALAEVAERWTAIEEEENSPEELSGMSV